MGQVDAVATWNGDYAYVAHDSVGDITVIDTNPINSAYIVGTIDVGDRAMDLDVQSGYAYVAAEYGGLRVYDVDPYGSASFVKSTWISGYAKKVDVQGSYAYVGSNIGLTIVDIDPPESTTTITCVSTGDVNGVYVSNGYAYLAISGYGLKVVDVDPPEDAYLLSEAETPGASVDVCAYNNYAYIADGLGGMRIFRLW